MSPPSSERAQRAIGLFTAIVGLLVLSSWALGLRLLRSFREQWASMKPDTALGFVLIGLSLWAHGVQARRRTFSRACAVGAAALATVAVGEYLVDNPIGINRFFWELSPAAPGVGRMAVTTAVAFACSSAALWLVSSRRRTSPFVPHLLAFVIAFIAFVGLLGYTYDVPDLYSNQSTSMAVHTALLFVLFAAGVIAAHPEDGLLSLITSQGPGGHLLRRLWLLVVTVPFALGWLRDLGRNAGLYSREVGTLWLVAAFGLAGLVWIANTARIMDRDARRISESEARYRTLADAVPQMIWILDPDGRVSYFNQRWYDYTGFTPAGNVEKKWIEYIHPDDLERLMGTRTQALAAAEPWEIEARARRKDGSYRWHLFRVVPLRAPSGAVLAWYGAALDIDERRRAEDVLRREVQIREQVVAVVSHDLRNPLNAIVLSTTLLRARLQSGVLDPGDVAAKTDVIRRAADQMHKLTQDLLDAAKIEAGKLALELRPEAPEQIVREVIETMRPQAEAKTIELLTTGEPAGETLSCDRHRVLQVFSNLVGNAIKFTPSAGRVTIGVRPEGEGTLFSVSDTGPGIPAEHLPRIFERFWQARETASGGTGLGLSIARGIVEAHGGRIWAESVPGRGATFFFWLPTAPVETAQGRAAAEGP
jgi:PAS domain S-box-containing protein